MAWLNQASLNAQLLKTLFINIALPARLNQAGPGSGALLKPAEYVPGA